jgi:hypothetical protein
LIDKLIDLQAKAPAKAEESAPAAAAPAPAQQPASQAPAPAPVPAPAQVPAPAVVQNAASQVVVVPFISIIAVLMEMVFYFFVSIRIRTLRRLTRPSLS